MKFRLTKRNIVFIVVGLAVVFVIGLLLMGHKTIVPPAKRTLVQLSNVKVASVPVVIHATADLLPNRQVVITPQVAGYVKSIHFDEGTHIEKGKVLIQLDNHQQKDKVAQEKAISELSDENYERNIKLQKDFMISAQDIDKLKSQKAQDEATLQTAQTTLSEMTLRAPFSGFLGAKEISVGDYIQPGTQVVTLTDISHLKVTYNVPARYSNDLKLQQAVKISSSSMPDKAFYGKVSYISPTVNEDNQTLTVHAVLTNHQNSLKPGEFVSLTQTLNKINNAVLVPENAILGNINGYYILQVKDGKVISTSIKPGEHYQGNVMILSGLKKGDKIITAGQNQVKAGDFVRTAK